MQLEQKQEAYGHDRAEECHKKIQGHSRSEEHYPNGGRTQLLDRFCDFLNNVR